MKQLLSILGITLMLTQSSLAQLDCETCDTIDFRDGAIPESVKEYMVESYFKLFQLDIPKFDSDFDAIDTVITSWVDTICVRHPETLDDDGCDILAGWLDYQRFNAMIICEKDGQPCCIAGVMEYIDEEGNYTGTNVLAWVDLSTLNGKWRGAEALRKNK